MHFSADLVKMVTLWDKPRIGWKLRKKQWMYELSNRSGSEFGEPI